MYYLDCVDMDYIYLLCFVYFVYCLIVLEVIWVFIGIECLVIFCIRLWFVWCLYFFIFGFYIFIGFLINSLFIFSCGCFF